MVEQANELILDILPLSAQTARLVRVHLGQIAILAQQQVIQITEHQSGCQRIVHVFFLLSVARKWVK